MQELPSGLDLGREFSFPGPSSPDRLQRTPLRLPSEQEPGQTSYDTDLLDGLVDSEDPLIHRSCYILSLAAAMTSTSNSQVALSRTPVPSIVTRRAFVLRPRPVLPQRGDQTITAPPQPVPRAIAPRARHGIGASSARRLAIQVKAIIDQQRTLHNLPRAPASGPQHRYAQILCAPLGEGAWLRRD